VWIGGIRGSTELEGFPTGGRGPDWSCPIKGVHAPVFEFKSLTPKKLSTAFGGLI